MGSCINVFLKTEITALPGLLDKYVGKYYNNTLCNGATWMFLLWYILHLVFDNLLNALLKRMKYKEYVRIRLKRSLWYLGFYTTACVYCGATLWRNNLDLISMKMPFDSALTSSGNLVLGFIVLTTFYLHSALWERLKYCHAITASSYLALFLMLCFSYFVRFVEGIFRLTIITCTTQIALELARCLAVLVKRDTLKENIITGIFFGASLITFVVNYLVVVPVLFGYPLVKGFTPSVTILLTFLLTWLALEIYGSVLSKAIFHWVNHIEEDELSCDNDLFECSLFPPRTDATYNFLIFKKEMKEREEKYMSLRRPKNRNMVVQTLKCMVAIKRKLKEKRQRASSFQDNSSDSSEETVEKLEDGDVDEVVGGKLEFSIHENDNKCKMD